MILCFFRFRNVFEYFLQDFQRKFHPKIPLFVVAPKYICILILSEYISLIIFYHREDISVPAQLASRVLTARSPLITVSTRQPISSIPKGKAKFSHLLEKNRIHPVDSLFFSFFWGGGGLRNGRMQSDQVLFQDRIL